MAHTRTAPPPVRTTASPRLWFVDNLRIVLTALVVVHHVAVMYSGMPLWYHTEKPDSGVLGLVLTVLLLVDQAWFMGAFFLLSGHFTPGSYDRKGPAAFLRDRLVRLGVPLVVGYFVLNPLLYAGTFANGSVVEAYVHAIGSGPLWFVLALLVFDTAYAVVRLATRRRRLGGRGGQECVDRGADGPVGPPPGGRGPLTWRAVLGFVPLLALVTYALRIVVPDGFWVPVVDFPTSAYLPQYVGFFVLGIVAYRRGWLAGITARMGWAGLGMAVGATVVFLPLALAGGASAWMGHGTASSLWYALWDSTFAVGAVLALLALFRHRFDRQGPLRRRLSRNAFTVYVLHAFLVTAAGYALGVVHLPTVAKVVIAVAVVVPLCFAVAEPIRRLPGVRRVL